MPTATQRTIPQVGALPSEELFLWVAVGNWDAWYQKLTAWVKSVGTLKGEGSTLWQDAIGMDLNKPSWYSSGIASASWVTQASELMIRFKEYQLRYYGPQSEGTSLDPNALPPSNDGDALKNLKTILILSGLGVGLFFAWPLLIQGRKYLKRSAIFIICFLSLSICTAGIGVASIYINHGEPNQENLMPLTFKLQDLKCNKCQEYSNPFYDSETLTLRLEFESEDIRLHQKCKCGHSWQYRIAYVEMLKAMSPCVRERFDSLCEIVKLRKS